MTNREKYITKRDEYDLMMAIAKRGCPLAIITGKYGPAMEKWQYCTGSCEECVQKWLNEEATRHDGIF